MINIREKLEILRHKLAGMISAAVEPCDEGECCESCKYFHSTACTDYLIADYMIANGVTVQEWIPASEPPETNGCYLVAGNLRWDGKPMAREAYWRGDAWLSCDGKHYITRRVTHWMPLPTPPKGE